MVTTRGQFDVTATFTVHNKPVNAFWALFQVPCLAAASPGSLAGCCLPAWPLTAAPLPLNVPVSSHLPPPQVPEVNVTAKAFLPSTSLVTFELANGLNFTTFVSTVPISGEPRTAAALRGSAAAWNLLGNRRVARSHA